MNHACPYCQRNLAVAKLARRAAPGSRRWLPLSTLPVCPGCDGLLQQNTHPSEQHALAMTALALCLALVLRAFFAQWFESLMPGSGQYAGIIWLLLLCGFAVWRQHTATRTIPANWPRYQRWTDARKP